MLTAVKCSDKRACLAWYSLGELTNGRSSFAVFALYGNLRCSGSNRQTRHTKSTVNMRPCGRWSTSQSTPHQPRPSTPRSTWAFLPGRRKPRHIVGQLPEARMPTQKLVRLHRLGKGKSGEVRPDVHDIRVDLGCASNGGGTDRAVGQSLYSPSTQRNAVKAP